MKFTYPATCCTLLIGGGGALVIPRPTERCDARVGSGLRGNRDRPADRDAKNRADRAPAFVPVAVFGDVGNLIPFLRPC